MLRAVLIVVAVVAVLGVLGGGTMAYLGYRTMRLHTAGNSAAFGASAQVTDSDLGVAAYPGATRKDGVGMRLKVGSNQIVSATLTTSDPVNAVVDFYRSKVGGQAIENKNVRGTSFESTSTSGGQKDSLVVTVAPDPTDSSLTQIVVLHTKSVTP